MPANFMALTAEDQWRSVVVHCKIRDSSNINDILNTPIPKESLMAVFPNAGRIAKVFTDIGKITMPLSQLRALEDSLANEQSEVDSRKTRRQMDANNKRIQMPVKYEATTDDLSADCHPRLLYNFPIKDPMEIFTSMAKKRIIPIASDLYPLHHINGGGCVTLKGWFEVANLGSTTISIKDFLLKNALRTNSGARRITTGQEGGAHFMETSVALQEATSAKECAEAFSMLLILRHRACPADCSLEPLFRFLNIHLFFVGDKEFKPESVNAGAFAAGFIDTVLHLNGMRFNTRMPFLSYAELYNVLREYKMTVKDTRGNENSRQDHKQGHSQQKQWSQNKGTPMFCHRFNNEKGNLCRVTDGDCTGKFGKTFKHLCNFKYPNGNMCKKAHPASKHKTKQEAE